MSSAVMISSSTRMVGRSLVMLMTVLSPPFAVVKSAPSVSRCTSFPSSGDPVNFRPVPSSTT